MLKDLLLGIGDNVLDGFAIGRLISEVLEVSENSTIAAFGASLFSGYSFALSGDVVVGPFDRQSCPSGTHSLYEYQLFADNVSSLPSISWPLDQCVPSFPAARLPIVVGVPVYDDCGREALRALTARFATQQRFNFMPTHIPMSAYNNSLRALLDNLDSTDAHLLAVVNADRFDRLFIRARAGSDYSFAVKYKEERFVSLC